MDKPRAIVHSALVQHCTVKTAGNIKISHFFLSICLTIYITTAYAEFPKGCHSKTLDDIFVRLDALPNASKNVKTLKANKTRNRKHRRAAAKPAACTQNP